MENQFLKNAMKIADNQALTENGANSYKSVGSELLTQFSTMGSARLREKYTVWDDQKRLWDEDSESALRFPFYLRMISRDTNVNLDRNTNKVYPSKGCGQKDEAFKRLLWIKECHSDEFYRNLWLLPVIGSWKDLVTLYVMDNTIDFRKIFEILSNGIMNNSTCDLVWKYMPRIHSSKTCTTPESCLKVEFARKFCKEAGISEEEYRKMKSAGKAHDFQKIICSRMYDEINWNKIPGIALLNLVSGNFLENHNLCESYMEWLKKQDKIKFNGFPVDLSLSLRKNDNKISRMTVDAQFNNLIDKMKNVDMSSMGNVLCALDTSGSMDFMCVNSNHRIRPIDVCLSLGAYFAELNTGAFHNIVAMFDNTSRLMEIPGTFSEKMDKIKSAKTAWGSTNFQSLISLLVDTRRSHPEIPLEDYPKTILVVSDMQFNYCGNETNVDCSRSRLREVFPEDWVNNLRFIWWNCVERGQEDVPATLDETNSLLISGYDGSILSLITAIDAKAKDNNLEKPSMEDLVNEALNQDILNLIN